MTNKKVSFGTKPQKQPNVDDWVENRDASVESEAQEKATIAQQVSVESTDAKTKGKEAKNDQSTMKRLTLDIPESLHRQIKGRAVAEGVTMVNMLRELLEENYG